MCSGAGVINVLCHWSELVDYIFRWNAVLGNCLSVSEGRRVTFDIAKLVLEETELVVLGHRVH